MGTVLNSSAGLLLAGVNCSRGVVALPTVAFTSCDGKPEVCPVTEAVEASVGIVTARFGLIPGSRNEGTGPSGFFALALIWITTAPEASRVTFAVGNPSFAVSVFGNGLIL
jgi:hypothetical protein